MNDYSEEDLRRLSRVSLSRWENDPCRFFEEVLGVLPWPKQREILESIASPNWLSTSVRSGHKCSKSNTAAGAALWWFCTRRDARVLMTSSSGNQVKNILWRELSLIYRRARMPIGGTLYETYANGLKHDDGREVIGFSTDTAEKAAGYSGTNILYIVDEASGVPEKIFETIEGNRASGTCRIVLFSNPTQLSGTFYESHTKQREFWNPIHVSSCEAAKFAERIPGLASQPWIDEKVRKWGVDDPRYFVRVLGEFPRSSTDTVITLDLITGIGDVDGAFCDGRLECGLDPAREGDDSSILTIRRGNVLLAAHKLAKGEGDAVAAEAFRVVMDSRDKTEDHSQETKPRVKVDVIGIGSSVYDHLKKHREIEAVAVNVAEKSNDPSKYTNLRGQVWFGLREWIREGGKIMIDHESRDMLEGELIAVKYRFDERNRYVLEPKKETKARLKRSPDYADSLALSVYNPPVEKRESAKAGSVNRFKRYLPTTV